VSTNKSKAIITKGGEYSLKYVAMWCEVASVVSELKADIEKSNLSLLIWGLFGSRGTLQLSFRGNGMNHQKQKSKKTWSVWCTIICWVLCKSALSLLRLTVFRKFCCSYDLFISYQGRWYLAFRKISHKSQNFVINTKLPHTATYFHKI